MIPLNKKTFVSFGIGLLFSAVALYFTFVNIPMRELVDYLRRINYWWIIPSILVSILSYLLRAWRWHLILSPVKISGFSSAFHPLAIGFMLNCIFPGRIGELARPAVYYKREGVEFSKVLATVGIERVMDALCLIIFFAFILAAISIDASIDLTFAGYHLTPDTLDALMKTTIKLSLALVALIGLISFSRSRTLVKNMILKCPEVMFFVGPSSRQKLKDGICTRLARILDNFAHGFDVLKSPGLMAACIALSFIIWALLGWSLQLHSFGCPGVQLTFLQAFAVEIIICFFIMLPSVPGYWGLWEAGGVFGLMIFGIPAKEAAGLVLTYHFFHLLPTIIIGLASALIIGVRIIGTAPSGEQQVNTPEKPAHGRTQDLSCEKD